MEEKPLMGGAGKARAYGPKALVLMFFIGFVVAFAGFGIPMAIFVTRMPAPPAPSPPFTMPSFGQEMRDQLFLLDPEATILNHGSYGAASLFVLNAQKYWIDQAQANTNKWFSEIVRPFVREIRKQVAAYVGAATEEIVFVENASSGINGVIRSINFKPTDKILLLNIAYGMVKNVVYFEQQRWGFGIVEVNVTFPTDAGAILAAVEEAYTAHPDITLAVFDHISSTPSLILPVNELVEIAHAHNSLVLIDGAHAVGQIPINMTAIGAEFYTSNAHKWLCASPGSAFLYVRRDVQWMIHPTVISFGYTVGSNTTYVAEFEWIGTRDFTPWLTWQTALQFRQNLTDAAVFAYNNNLCSSAAQLFIDSFPGSSLMVPANMSASLTSVEIGCTATNGTSGPCFQWPLGPTLTTLHNDNIWPVMVELTPNGRRFVRLSCQIYNKLDDYRHFVTRLKEIIHSYDTAAPQT